MKIEIRSDSIKLSGYVNAVERRSAVLPQRVCRDAPGDFVEVIRSGTFGESLKRNPDVALRFNHERTVADSVELREDNIGLHAEATVSDGFSHLSYSVYSSLPASSRTWSSISMILRPSLTVTSFTLYFFRKR